MIVVSDFDRLIISTAVQENCVSRLIVFFDHSLSVKYGTNDFVVADIVFFAIIEDADIYRLGDEEYYIPSGSTYSVFRLLVKDDEYVLMEFYRTD